MTQSESTGAYDSLATYLILKGIVSKSELLDEIQKHSLTFRKNKSIEDILSAIKKALKYGNYSTEGELQLLSNYLQDVLKVVRK